MGSGFPPTSGQILLISGCFDGLHRDPHMAYTPDIFRPIYKVDIRMGLFRGQLTIVIILVLLGVQE